VERPFLREEIFSLHSGQACIPHKISVLKTRDPIITQFHTFALSDTEEYGEG
jgi:hypothetical protein